MSALILFKKFIKGCEYFNKQLRGGAMNPFLGRQIRDFEREVIIPFDQACARMTKDQRIRMEMEMGYGFGD